MQTNYIRVIILSFFTFLFFNIKAQNVGVNATGIAPDVSAGFDVDFTNKGLLIPRVALTGINDAATIFTPAKSLLVYNDGSILTPAGYYYNSGTTIAPVWVQLLNGGTPGTAWLLGGNTGTTAGTNFIGTTDAQDLVFKTNNTEQMRVLSSGNIAIATPTPTTNYLLTIKPTTNSLRSGISISMSGATSIAYGINISAGNTKSRGFFYANTTIGAGVIYGTGSELSNTYIVSGYTAYRNSTNSASYGLYGINGTNASYATNANTWAAFLQGRTVISSETSPSSPLGTDLEIRNTTPGIGNPATLSLRQTTANTTSNTVLTQINFGDNHSTSPQASLSVIRDAAGGIGDLPTAIAFSTTPDGTSTLTERIRITSAGNVLIGTSTPVNNAILSLKDGHLQTSQTTPPTIAANANAGVASTASLSATSNDIVGQITLTEGTSGWLSGVQCTVNFNKAYTSAPIVLLTAINSIAASGTPSQQVFVTSTTTTFSINFVVSASANLNWKWNYVVLEP